MIFHVVAVANGNVIGKDNKLPWHFSSDLKFFKNLTTGSTVIMGRKTYESIGKPLPNRENFVLSRQSSLIAQEHLKIFNSLEDAIKQISTKDAYIIGGENLYRQSLAVIDGIYLTRIHADFEGDAFYPEIPKVFKEAGERLKLQENPLIEVITYKKEKNG